MQPFFPHSDVTPNLSAKSPEIKYGIFLAKLLAFHCHRSNYFSPDIHVTLLIVWFVVFFHELVLVTQANEYHSRC